MKKEENEESVSAAGGGGGSTGFLLAGLARASVYGMMKKGLIMLPIKKKAFLKIGELTTTSTKPLQQAKGMSRDENKLTKDRLGKGIPKEIAKSLILGVTVFGTYEYLVYHFLNVNDVPDHGSNFSFYSLATPVWIHATSGACAGVMQSVVLTCWELVAKVSSHHLQLPHNLRTSFLLRRTVHHSVGYASLFGTYEATRRILLHAVDSLYFDNRLEHSSVFTNTFSRNTDDSNKNINADYTKEAVSLATAFIAGGTAGQVHQFVNFTTVQWKLQILQTSRHISQIIHLPPLRTNLSAFVPTALCFLAFQYGGDVTTRLAHQYDETE